MPKNSADAAMEWIAEADYIQRTATVRGNVAEMNHDAATFVRYCDMQATKARREGFVHIAAAIEESAALAAQPQLLTREDLAELYRCYCYHGIGRYLGSADEHLTDERLTDSQRALLARFCASWELAE